MPNATFRLALTLLIVSLSLLGVLVRPRGISEAVASVAGAALLLLTGLVPLHQAARLLLDSWNILLFFAGLILIAWATEQSGFFRWTALWAVRLAGGSGRRLLLNVFALGVLISTFLSNDATALLLTPVVVSLAQETGLSPLPFALACTFIADTASVTLPVSNPINVVFLQSFGGIRLGDYLGHLLAPSVAAIAINVAVFVFLFSVAPRRPRSSLDRTDDRLDQNDRIAARFETRSLPAPASAIANPRYFRYTLVCLALLAVSYLAVATAGGPLSLVALGGAAALLAGGLALHALPIARVRRIPWAIVPFVAGLLVLVQSLENAGVTAWLGARLIAVSGLGALQGILVTTLGSALGANAVNNLPMATVLAASIRQASLSPAPLRHGLVYAAIFGCDIGPNLTILGSLSTVLWLVLLRERGVTVTSWRYIRTGLLVTPLMLVAGAILIALL